MVSIDGLNERGCVMSQTRDEQRHSAVDGPLRYFGFSDEGAYRIFTFGRLPERDGSAKYRVSVSLAFFSRHKMSLQEGPEFCAAILSRQTEPKDFEATPEDLERFLASRPVRLSGSNVKSNRFRAPGENS